MGLNKLNFNLFKSNSTSQSSPSSGDTLPGKSDSSDASSSPGSIDSFVRSSSTADNLGNQPSLYQRLFGAAAQGSSTSSEQQAGSYDNNAYAAADAGSLGLPRHNTYTAADAGSLGINNQYADTAKTFSAANPYAAADAGSLGIFKASAAGAQAAPVANPGAINQADALYTLVTNWETIAGSSGSTTLSELRDIAADEDAPPSIRAAANYFDENSQEFNALDTAARGGSPNEHVSTDDLIVRAVAVLPEPYMLQLLVSNFDELLNDEENPNGHTVWRSTLDKVAASDEHPIDVRVAAQYYTTHPEQFDALDSVSNGETDSKVSIEDVRARQSQIGVVHNFQQVSSHNTFEEGGVAGLSEVYNDGAVRSFELDLHDNTDSNGWLPGGKNDLAPGEWDVRHFGADGSEGRLDAYLQEIATITEGSDGPVSLFLDLKSALGSDGHNPEDLDIALHNQFGDRLFTPADFIASVPGATNLQEAIELGGWPTEEQLDGKIFVVLTAKTLDEYYAAERADGIEAAAFIAPKAQTEDGVFVPQDNAIFYNVNASSGADDVAALNQQIVGDGFLVRNYEVDTGNFEKIAASGATFIATDYHDELAAGL